MQLGQRALREAGRLNTGDAFDRAEADLYGLAFLACLVIAALIWYPGWDAPAEEDSGDGD